ncbi:tetratricopeptide repeat protein 33-like [Diadema antillarum]|uniref:tetratricopeptide repeat protein 33-like n=1 Tax=Diadema antillarum TaxID=105358 RepID=UPI003A86FBF8
MTSFGWKRKVGERVSKKSSAKFEDVTGGDDSADEDAGVHGNQWDAFSKRRKIFLLEDGASKSNRLRTEGETLAEAGRYWEAISKWDEALQLTPGSAELNEMKAQVLMELQEVYPAVEAAHQATTANPRWWIAHQTLGRAQLGLGEITMAIKSFSRAIHINPAERDLWESDLQWAWSLQRRAKKRRKGQRQYQEDVGKGGGKGGARETKGPMETGHTQEKLQESTQTRLDRLSEDNVEMHTSHTDCHDNSQGGGRSDDSSTCQDECGKPSSLFCREGYR